MNTGRKALWLSVVASVVCSTGLVAVRQKKYKLKHSKNAAIALIKAAEMQTMDTLKNPGGRGTQSSFAGEVIQLEAADDNETLSKLLDFDFFKDQIKWQLDRMFAQASKDVSYKHKGLFANLDSEASDAATRLSKFTREMVKEDKIKAPRSYRDGDFARDFGSAVMMAFVNAIAVPFRKADENFSKMFEEKAEARRQKKMKSPVRREIEMEISDEPSSQELEDDWFGEDDDDDDEPMINRKTDHYKKSNKADVDLDDDDDDEFNF